MPRRIWNVNVDNVDHVVELKHSYLSGKKSISLDGRLVMQTGVNIIDLKSDFRFLIGTHPCLTRITSNGITFDRVWCQARRLDGYLFLFSPSYL
ncbi:MAG TPA: hypothetical protein PLW11_11790 [Bacillota bacterium]|nr:hypothetical protein [Bacillota bacterium]